MKRRSFTFALAALIAAPMLSAPLRAEDTADPAQFVANFAQRAIVDILAAQVSNGEKQQRFRAMFKEYFDLPAIGRFVLGPYSRNVQPADQEKFDTLFEDVIVYTWSRRFAEYNGQSLKVTSAAPDANGAIVKSTIVDKTGSNIVVDWRLRKKDGYKALDVIISGVSMAITYRQEYATIIAQNGGMTGLLAQLQKQVDELKRQQPV